jgi:hypothetical protein
MYTVLNQDEEPGYIAAGNYRLLYVAILGAACALTLVRDIYKKQTIYFTMLFQVPCLVIFALLYNNFAEQIELASGIMGTNTTLITTAKMLQCPINTNCSCVAECASGYQCVNTPCIVDFSPEVGLTQCSIEYVDCYNKTTISILSYNNIFYLYENSTYTFPGAPSFDSDSVISQRFLPWDPLYIFPQDYSPNGSVIFVIILLVTFTVLTLFYICFNNENNDINEVKENNDNVNQLPPPPYESDSYSSRKMTNV